MRKIDYLKIYTSLLLIIILGVIAFLSFNTIPNSINVSNYAISSNVIPSEFNGFKIGYISDTVLKDTEDLERFAKIIEKINKQNFDLVLFGGDLFDSEVFEATTISEYLRDIKATHGKFAILGEKDYTNYAEIVAVIQQGGFEVISNETRPIYYNNSSILLVGFDSSDGISTLINEQNNGLYKIAIAHQPDLFDYATSHNINLQLSGHSHGGYIQIPLFGSLIKRDGASNYSYGKYTVNQSQLIVSNGLGMENNQSARFISTPEIVTITLTK